VRSTAESRNDACSGRYSVWSVASAAGVMSTDSPTSASAIPNHTSGRRTRSPSRPPAKLPSARPPMKLAHTVLAA
jgi:hypothetical protein